MKLVFIFVIISFDLFGVFICGEKGIVKFIVVCGLVVLLL